MKPIERKAFILYGDLLDGVVDNRCIMELYRHLCVLTDKPVLQWYWMDDGTSDDESLCVLCAEGIIEKDGTPQIQGDLEYVYDCIADVSSMLKVNTCMGYCLFHYNLPEAEAEELKKQVMGGIW